MIYRHLCKKDHILHIEALPCDIGIFTFIHIVHHHFQWFGIRTKEFPKQMLTYGQLDLREQTTAKFQSNWIISFRSYDKHQVLVCICITKFITIYFRKKLSWTSKWIRSCYHCSHCKFRFTTLCLYRLLCPCPLSCYLPGWVMYGCLLAASGAAVNGQGALIVPHMIYKPNTNSINHGSAGPHRSGEHVANHPTLCLPPTTYVHLPQGCDISLPPIIYLPYYWNTLHS